MAATMTLGLVLVALGQAVAEPPAAPPPDNPAAAGAASSLAEDAVTPFVPLHPRTAEGRQEIEAVRDFVAARALEDRQQRQEAIVLLEEALEKSPDSLAILRRLGQLCLLLGRNDDAARYARRVLDVEPGDTTMLGLLLEDFSRRNDFNGIEGFLTGLRDNPRLVKGSAGDLLIHRTLGLLYAGPLRRLDRAADALGHVVEELDAKTADRLSPADLRRILGGDEAEAYVRFGAVFVGANRYPLAIKAFQRGLAYDPDHPELPRLLAEALLQSGQAEPALKVLEDFLRRQPQGREPYLLLVDILTRLDRKAEIVSRLEAAAKNDPKNAPLQYLLADQYREDGQKEKAEALYKELLATQPDPQGFGALSASLLRDRKADELIGLLGEAFAKPDTLEAVKPQIELIVGDPAFVGQLLDAGLKLQQADPPKLSRESRLVLSYIATKAKQLDKLVPIQRLALQRDPSPQAYREFWLDLYRNGKYADAAATLDEMIAKYPAEKTLQILVALAQSRALANQLEPALAAVEEALRLDAGEQEALRLKGYILGRLDRNDEAIAHYKRMIEQFPDNDEVVKRARSGLSVIYVNQEKLAEGEAELEILLEREPDDPGINNDLGYLYADQGKDLEKAEGMIRKAIAEDPENTAYLDSLGWVLYKRGKFREAVESLEKAALDATADSTIHDHLGDTYFKLQELKKARDAWKVAEAKAAEAVPPDRRLGEIRKKLESLKALDPTLTGDPPDGAPKP
jgi:tetratricopeptide (TPR) repeat protein